MKAALEVAHLEDFGVHGIVSPAERFEEYQVQCKGLSRKLQARFWLGVLERDPDVRRLLDVKDKKKRRRY
jgi:hypothetical protein